MTVYIDFELDTKQGLKTKTVQSPYADLGQTRDNLEERLDNVGKSGKALMPLRDADTGDYVFVHTMKIGAIEIYERNAQTEGKLTNE